MPLDRTAFYADSSTALSLATITANMADAEADQIALREIQTFQWADATARAAQTGMAEGDVGYQADANASYYYTGASWLRQDGRIIPSAATNGTVSAAGVVTSTAQSLVRLRDCFPTDFTVFRVVFDVTTSAATGLNARLAVDATDAATAYDNERFTAVSTTGAAVQSLNTTDAQIGPIGVAGARHFGSFIITDPNIAGPTYIDSSAIASPPAAMTTATGKEIVSVMHRTSTAYNSLTFTASSGNVTLNRVTVHGVS